jgi:hypothetical protein
LYIDLKFYPKNIKVMSQVSDQALAELSAYLEKTLSPDPNIRRPGKPFFSLLICLLNKNIF